MARTKTNTRKSKSVSDHDRYTAELSTGQLVIGVCILLMLMLGCFLMGIVIGRFEPTPYTTAALEGPGVEAAVTPAPTQAPRETATPQETIAARTATRTSSPPPEMRVPLRTLGKSEAKTSKKTDMPKTEARSAQKTPAVSSEPPTISQEELPKPTQVAKSTPAKAAPVPEKTAEATQTAKTDAKTRYGVQIASLGNRQRAEALKRDLEAKSSYRADVIAVDGGKILRVLVGSYADHETASHVRDTLRDEYGMKDCFVTARR